MCQVYPSHLEPVFSVSQSTVLLNPTNRKLWRFSRGLFALFRARILRIWRRGLRRTFWRTLASFGCHPWILGFCLKMLKILAWEPFLIRGCDRCLRISQVFLRQSRNLLGLFYHLEACLSNPKLVSLPMSTSVYQNSKFRVPPSISYFLSPYWWQVSAPELPTSYSHAGCLAYPP